MSHTRTRRRFSAEQKAAVVRRHVGGKEPISKLAEELGVQPGMIHNWVNQVLAQAEKAFEKTTENGRDEKLKDRRIEQWQAKLVNKNNEHNGKIPRDFWLEDWEKQAIVDYHDSHPLNGYRRLTFMMLDDHQRQWLAVYGP